MFYHLFKYLDNVCDIPGSGMFQYISFRAAIANILALLIIIFFGKRIIGALRRHQIGETVRDLGLQGQLEKKGTPTMGGVLILLAITVPMLLVGRLDNVYVQLMIVSTLWCGAIGFLDDYIKVFRHNKEGLKGRFKIVGQVGLGIIVGSVMCFSENIVVREHTTVPVQQQTVDTATGEQVLTTVQQSASTTAARRPPRPRFLSSRTTSSITVGSWAATKCSHGYSMSSSRYSSLRQYPTERTSRTVSTGF